MQLSTVQEPVHRRIGGSMCCQVLRCPSNVQKTGSQVPCGKGVGVGSGRQARLMRIGAIG